MLLIAGGIKKKKSDDIEKYFIYYAATFFAVWLYQKHVLWMMKVTASLGLWKISWCPGHGIQLSEGTAACLHGCTCNAGASLAPPLFLEALQKAVGEEQEASVAMKAGSSSRAQKQVYEVKLPFIFIPLWEVNWFQAKRTLQKVSLNRDPADGQLCAVEYRSTILSGAEKMQDGAKP